jgi:hypothetical protein
MRNFKLAVTAAIITAGLCGAVATAQADPPWNHGGDHRGGDWRGGDRGDWHHHGWNRGDDDDERGGWGGPGVYVQAPPPAYYAPPPAYYNPPPPPPAYYPPPPAYYAPPVLSFGLNLPFGDGDRR